MAVCDLAFVVWNLFVIWCLSFGTCLLSAPCRDCRMRHLAGEVLTHNSHLDRYSQAAKAGRPRAAMYDAVASRGAPARLATVAVAIRGARCTEARIRHGKSQP